MTEHKSTETTVSPASRTQTQRRARRGTVNGCNHAQPMPGTWAELRHQSGLSLRDLEHRAQINRGDLSKIENGRLCPTPDQALRLLAALYPR